MQLPVSNLKSFWVLKCFNLSRIIKTDDLIVGPNLICLLYRSTFLVRPKNCGCISVAQIVALKTTFKGDVLRQQLMATYFRNNYSIREKIICWTFFLIILALITFFKGRLELIIYDEHSKVFVRKYFLSHLLT